MSGVTEGPATTETPPVDPFIEALKLLDERRPTPRAERLFSLLTWLVLGALALTVLYLILVPAFHVVSPGTAPYIAWSAASLYLLIVPVCGLNLGLVRTLRGVASLLKQWTPERKEQLGRELKARPDRPPVAGLAALTVLGAVFVLLGGIGLTFEVIRANYRAQFLLAIVMIVFGISCVLLYYVAQGRQRLRVIDDLHASLLAGEPRAVDAMTRYDRREIDEDRERSIKAEADFSGERRYAFRESRAVRDVKHVLPVVELMAVLSHIDRVLSNPPRVTGHICYDRIDGTHLELGYRVDHAAREVRLVSLTRAGSPRPAVDESQSADTDQTKYRVNFAPSVKPSERLSAEKIKAADAIIAKLAEAPTEFRHLAASRQDGRLVLRNAPASVAVMYSVDDAKKTVNVEHLASPIPALRTLFVSYSKKDQDSYAKVMQFVHKLEEEGLVQIWSDELLRAADQWHDRIGDAIDSAQAALLLVSQNFLSSTYINNVELPRLLARAEQNLTKIFWVPVKLSTVFETDIEMHKKIPSYQSLLKPPTTPLRKLEAESEARCDEALLEIYTGLRRALLSQG